MLSSYAPDANSVYDQMNDPLWMIDLFVENYVYVFLTVFLRSVLSFIVTVKNGLDVE